MSEELDESEIEEDVEEEVGDEELEDEDEEFEPQDEYEDFDEEIEADYEPLDENQETDEEMEEEFEPRDEPQDKTPEVNENLIYNQPIKEEPYQRPQPPQKQDNPSSKPPSEEIPIRKTSPPPTTIIQNIDKRKQKRPRKSGKGLTFNKNLKKLFQFKKGKKKKPFLTKTDEEIKQELNMDQYKKLKYKSRGK